MTPLILPLKNYVLLKVQGKNTASFLQGMLTADLREVSDQRATMTAHCNAKGRVLFDAQVFFHQQHFYLLIHESMCTIATSALEKYARLSRVTLEKDHSFSLLGVYGHEIHEALCQQLGQLPLNYHDVLSMECGLILRLPGNLPRYLLIGEASWIDDLYQMFTEKYEYDEGHRDQWQQIDIQNKIAHIYPETSGLFTPNQLNYPELAVVSFKKGCYIGQEIIARTHYLGKTRRSLQTFQIKSPKQPKPGDSLTQWMIEQDGFVLEAALLDSGDYELLALLS